MDEGLTLHVAAYVLLALVASGLVAVAYLLTIWLDRGEEPRSPVLTMLLCGAATIELVGLAVSPIAVHYIVGVPSVPGSQTVVALSLIGALIVPHFYALYIWRLRR